MRLLLASIVLTSTVAAAEPYELGVRVGGYGFHRENASGNDAWSLCRMNGMGIFGNHGVRGPLFVEAALDTYFSANQAMPSDLPIDRQSAVLSAAVGARTSFASWIGGYAQLGLGAELARVAVPYGDSTIRDDKLLPDAFVGFGIDIRISSATYIGAAMRTHVMGNFQYDPMRLSTSNQWVAQPSSSDVFAASPSFAEQGQFYLRHQL